MTDRPLVTGTLESALYGSDVDAAEAFYAGLLGLPVLARGGDRHVFFRVGQSVLLFFNPAQTEQAPLPGGLPVPAHGARGPGHYCFASEHLDDWRAYLDQCGTPIEADFLWPGGARSIYLRDPAGNSVEFSSSALWF